MARDTDLNPVSVRCRREPTPKDAEHVACAPELYVSPLVWDGADNSVFRPLSDGLALGVSREAVNADELDEVADSAWFENRLGRESWTPERLARGACTQAQLLTDTESVGGGAWIVDKGKDNGASPGFRVKVPGHGRFMLKSDAPAKERPSAAAVIGAAAYYAAGFNFSCEQVVFLERGAFTLTPGLTVTDNTERVRPFDEAAFDKVLAGTTKRADAMRFQASAWLEGRLLGPFRYEGTRDDDPNDVIPHEDRRELRGGRLLAAWLNHFDAREQNSMDAWVSNDRSRPDSSPGYVKHYYLDTSDTLGGEWDWDSISRRLGHSYLADWGDMSVDFLSLGLVSRPWDRAERTPGREIFGYFSARDFDPEKWVNEYPNPAFSRMTERDGAWMARILAGFSPELVWRLAELGQFSSPENTAFLARTLQERLDRILARYLTRLSSLGRVHLEGTALCAMDLAELRQVRDVSQFRPHASWGDGTRAALPVRHEAGGRVCVDLPTPTAGGGQRGYRTVVLENGVSTGPLVVHLYDSGPSEGYHLAGLQRPDAPDVPPPADGVRPN